MDVDLVDDIFCCCCLLYQLDRNFHARNLPWEINLSNNIIDDFELPSLKDAYLIDESDMDKIELIVPEVDDSIDLSIVLNAAETPTNETVVYFEQREKLMKEFENLLLDGKVLWVSEFNKSNRYKPKKNNE